MRRLLLVLALACAVQVPSAPPAAAQNTLVSFRSPSRATYCQYAHFRGESPFLRCDVAVSRVPPRPRSCELDYGSAFGLGLRGRARRLCVGDTAADQRARVLPYGVTRRYGPFRCRVSRTRGMLCTAPSGHGFELSRDRQRLF